MAVLLGAVLTAAAVPAHAQADPACYVVNRVLLWLKPQFPAVECARARSTPAPGADKTTGRTADAPAPPAPQQIHPTHRRQA